MTPLDLAKRYQSHKRPKRSGELDRTVERDTINTRHEPIIVDHQRMITKGPQLAHRKIMALRPGETLANAKERRVPSARGSNNINCGNEH